jgi:hypothetical protein
LSNVDVNKSQDRKVGYNSCAEVLTLPSTVSGLLFLRMIMSKSFIPVPIFSLFSCLNLGIIVLLLAYRLTSGVEFKLGFPND